MATNENGDAMITKTHEPARALKQNQSTRAQNGGEDSEDEELGVEDADSDEARVKVKREEDEEMTKRPKLHEDYSAEEEEEESHLEKDIRVKLEELAELEPEDLEEEEQEIGMNGYEEDEDDDDGPPPGWGPPLLKPEQQQMLPPPPPLLPEQSPLPSTHETVQVMCGTCRQHLSYPKGSRYIRCPKCQLVNQATEEKAQMVCGFCRRLLTYPPGSRFVECSCCKRVNYVLEESEIEQVKCGYCASLLMYPSGSPSVRCSSCHFVTDITDSNRRPLLSMQQGRVTPPPNMCAH